MPRLADALAGALVEHSISCLRDAGVAPCRLALSAPVDGFARVYDTLVLEFRPQTVHLEPTASPSIAARVREALVLLRALSRCDGYSFYGDFPFWNSAFGLRLSNGVAVAMTRFPRVLLDWNPADLTDKDAFDAAANQCLLHSSVLQLFTTSYALSPIGQMWKTFLVTQFCVSPVRPIECTVSIRFERIPSATEGLVLTLISSATVAALTQTEFVWTGVCVAGSEDLVYPYHGLSPTNLMTLTRLCASLPSTLSLSVRIPKKYSTPLKSPVESLRPALEAFVSRAIGRIDKKMLGRMEVLDLTFPIELNQGTSPLDFACLCTLLPFSRSLRKLCVSVTTTNDVLWLMYAVLHPLAADTPWRALHLYGHPTSPIDWWSIRYFVQARSRLSAVWSLLTLPNSYPRWYDTGDPPGYLVRRTAKITSDAPVLSWIKTSMIATLKPGHLVELCDTTTADELTKEFGNHVLDDVAVIVAGVGIGWIHKRHLAEIIDTRYSSPTSSSLTTLSLRTGVVLGYYLPMILPWFAPSLRHLRAAIACRFSPCAVSTSNPQLESLEMTFTKRVKNTMGSMPNLLSIGVVCDEQSMEECFKMLQRLPVVRSIRFEFRERYAMVPRWYALRSYLRTLVRKTTKKSLRSLTIVINSRYDRRFVELRDIGGVFCAPECKLALLSVLHSTRAAVSTNVLSRLDAYVIHEIFAYAGPGVRFSVEYGDDSFTKKRTISRAD